MSNKKKLSEMRAKKAALEAKIKTIREGRAQSGLAFLIENELEKAEIILAAKSIVDKLGKMAEDLAKVEGDDVMPMMDSLKAAYGPQMAANFQKTAGEVLRKTVEALTHAKDNLGSEVGKFEGVLNGDSVGNDMASYSDDAAVEPEVEDEADIDLDLGDEMDAEIEADDGDEFDFGDEESEDLEDLFGDEPTGNAAGRARKESVSKRGNALNEGLLDSMKSYLAQHVSKAPAHGSPRERLEALKPFLTAEDYEIVGQFPDHLLEMIFKSLDNEADNVPAIADYDDFGGVPMVSPLAAVEDPDAAVYDQFRESVRSGSTPIVAARKVAEAFHIDLADVVEIVKESVNKKVEEDCDGDTKKKRKSKDISFKDWSDKVKAAVKKKFDTTISSADLKKHYPDHKDCSTSEFVKWYGDHNKLKESTIGPPSNKVKVTPQERGNVGVTKELPGGAKFTRPFTSKAAADKHMKDKNLVSEKKGKKRPF